LRQICELLFQLLLLDATRGEASHDAALENEHRE
jgi:hypothetical protein